MQSLFYKYLQGNCSELEVRELLAYFEQPENELLLKQLIMTELDSKKEATAVVSNLDDRLSGIHGRIMQNIRPHKRVMPWWRIAAAAVVLFVMGATLFLINRNSQSNHPVTGSAALIRPGKYAATLTLANGKKVLLNQARAGQIALQAGVTVTKTSDGRIVYQTEPQGITDAAGYNTLSTAPGELYTVVLPDGTEVTLNAASSLTYPADINRQTVRKVTLTGEGYFMVKHNAEHPFKVSTRGQEVEDIGTEFNISSYTDEPNVLTTLVTGSAKVMAENNYQATLAPAQQASLSAQGLKVSQVDPALFTSWRKGLFVYQHTPLQNVMRQVARWYDVKVVYETDELKTKKLSGSVSRYNEISGLLNAIAYTAKVKFRIENKQIIVSNAE